MSDFLSGAEGTPPPPPRRRVALHWQILVGLVGGCAAGVVARLIWPPAADGTPDPTLEWIARNLAEPVGQIFLRLIMMVVIPLVFSALVLACVELGEVWKLGRLGLRTLMFTVVFSSLSVLIGLTLANTIKPGTRLSQETRTNLSERYQTKAAEATANARKAKSVRDTILDIIPRNPLQEMVGALDGSSPGGGMLSVMFFALVFGTAMAAVPQRTAGLVAVFQGVYDVVMVIIQFTMHLAPLGVAGLLFAVTSLFGLEVLTSLFWYVVTVISGLSLQAIVVYSAALWLFARRSPRAFYRGITDAIVTAFATSSSNATLPTAIRVTEENLGVRPQVARFVLTVGSTANQNGTALYEGITVLFLAQVFGVELSLANQVTVVLMSILAGIGTAGIPGGSLPLVVILLESVGVSGAGIAIIMGIDRLLDMCRTTLNVTGDIVVAACADRTTP